MKEKLCASWKYKLTVSSYKNISQLKAERQNIKPGSFISWRTGEGQLCSSVADRISNIWHMADMLGYKRADNISGW